MLLDKIISLVLLTKLAEAKNKIESKVVRGDKVPITQFAHSAFLLICESGSCFVCGASVINQKILLTAGHCIDTCGKRCLEGFASVGEANKRKGNKIRIIGTKLHEEYSRQRIRNDIGLVLLEKSLNLGDYIKRVAILKKPPIGQTAVVAGWGLIDEVNDVHTDLLHSTKQRVWAHDTCEKMISNIPDGTLCAGNIADQKYASEGDSGSALIINDYIQIGIVSYKRPDISRAVVVYADVAYYYDWITYNSRELYCDNQ